MHAHHHKIYVPYAFGAFYNTLSEAFLLDTIGTTLSLMVSGLSTRQAMWFSTISVMKGVDDHCGYRLPWDPLQWLGEQNTTFHDVHHQNWGIKVSLVLPKRFLNAFGHQKAYGCVHLFFFNQIADLCYLGGFPPQWMGSRQDEP